MSEMDWSDSVKHSQVVYLKHYAQARKDDAPKDRKRTPVFQSRCGHISGHVRAWKGLMDVVTNTNMPEESRLVKRRIDRARKAAIVLAGTIENSRKDDEYQMDRLKRGEGWLSSMVIKARQYLLKAYFWSYGELLDFPKARHFDPYTDGLQVLGLDGSESLDEILARLKDAFPPKADDFFSEEAHEPPYSPSGALVVTGDATSAVEEVKPTSRVRRFVLAWEEYQALKMCCRPEELRRAAGRMAHYKQSGNAAGMYGLLQQLRYGRKLVVGGNKDGVNRKKQRDEGPAARIMCQIFGASKDIRQALGRIGDFMNTGEVFC